MRNESNSSSSHQTVMEFATDNLKTVINFVLNDFATSMISEKLSHH